MKNVFLDIGADRVDLMLLPPVSVGFKSRLFEATKINYDDKFTPTQEFAFVHYMLALLRPGTTAQEVEKLPASTVKQLYWVVGRIDAEAFNPVGWMDDNDKAYIPTVSQAGKDVIWVPTPMALVETMLNLGNVGPQTHLIDLGSGDGRTVLTAAKRGARAEGCEFNPEMFAHAERRRQALGLDNAQFHNTDLFDADLSPATVVTLYLLPQLNLRLRERLMSLKPGTIIVSHQFDMGGWEPDCAVLIGAKTVYKWTVA